MPCSHCLVRVQQQQILILVLKCWSEEMGLFVVVVALGWFFRLVFLFFFFLVWFVLVFLFGGTLASAFLEDSFLCPFARTTEEDPPSTVCLQYTLQNSPFGNQKGVLCILLSEQGFG